MNCECGAIAKAIETRVVDGGNIGRRRYACAAGHRFTTTEIRIAGSMTTEPLARGQKTGAVPTTRTNSDTARLMMKRIIHARHEGAEA